jgi:hypothetical protein
MPNKIDAFRQWLADNDIARLHPSGRWRVRFSDTQTFELPGDVYSVGGFFSENPTDTDKDFFHQWRESDERQQKQKAAAFLRFAQYRHLVDGDGKNQVTTVKKMCAHIRDAMKFFSNGNLDDGNDNMNKAWGFYMMLVMRSERHLVMKGIKFKPGKREGSKGRFTQLVEKTAAEAKSKDWKSVVRALESADQVQEVDWESEKIWITGEDNPRSFKTVKNLLAKI